MEIGIVEFVKGYAEAFGLSTLLANREVFTACEIAGMNPRAHYTEEQWLEIVLG